MFRSQDWPPKGDWELNVEYKIDGHFWMREVQGWKSSDDRIIQFRCCDCGDNCVDADHWFSFPLIVQAWMAQRVARNEDRLAPDPKPKHYLGARMVTDFLEEAVLGCGPRGAWKIYMLRFGH